MMAKLGIKAYHHHFGVLPSATPAIWSDNQPRGRLLSTNGSRSNSLGVCGIVGTSLIRVSAAISALLSSQPARGSRDSHCSHVTHVARKDCRLLSCTPPC